MESAATLEGTGIPGIQAQAIGHVIATLVAAGTTAGTATAIGTNTVVLATTAASQTGLILPACAPGHEVLVYCFSATTAVVFPDTLSTIDAGTPTTGSVNIATKVARRFIRTGATTWISMLTA
jgi:hypothetical protein